MKTFLLFIIMIIQVNLSSQNNPDGSIDFDYITKPGEIRYTTNEKLSIDSFATMVEEYKRLEINIIKKLYEDSISNVLKQNYINQYVCNIAYSLDENLKLYIKLIKNDNLLSPKFITYKGKEVMSNCITSFKIRKLVAEKIIENRELYDCTFFDKLKYINDSRFKNLNSNKIDQIKKEDKLNNNLYMALLLKDYESDLRKVVADEYANDCYRKNAKLILEALDKNK